MKVKKGKGTIETRKVAFLIDAGASRSQIDQMKSALAKEKAQAVLIGPHVGRLKLDDNSEVEIKHSYLTEASVCYDAFFTPNGKHIDALAKNPDYLHFINEGFRHCKALAFGKDAESLAAKSFIDKDAGVIFESKENLTQNFIECMKMHRVWEREKARKVPA